MACRLHHDAAMIATDVMTPRPRTIRVDASINAALDVLWTLEVRHLPVVDDDGELVGMLSDRDVGALMRTFREGGSPLTNRRVGELMSADVIAVDVDADVGEVIETLIEERIGAVPVIDGEGSVVGIISYVDLLRTYAGELGAATDNGRTKKKPSGQKTPKKKAAQKKKVAQKK